MQRRSTQAHPTKFTRVDSHSVVGRPICCRLRFSLTILNTPPHSKHPLMIRGTITKSGFNTKNRQGQVSVFGVGVLLGLVRNATEFAVRQIATRNKSFPMNGKPEEAGQQKSSACRRQQTKKTHAGRQQQPESCHRPRTRNSFSGQLKTCLIPGHPPGARS